MTMFRLGTISPVPYRGWVRGVAHGTDQQIHDACIGRTEQIQFGRRVGATGRMVHVFSDPRPIAPVPTDVDAPQSPHFSIAGQALSIVDQVQDGPAWWIHYRGVLSPFATADLWITWYPAQPWADIEVLLTGGRIGLDQLQGSLPDPQPEARDGACMLRGAHGSLPCTNGQGQAWAGIVVWPSRLAGDGASAISAWQAPPELVIDTGVQFGPLGRADMTGQSVRAWGARHLPSELAQIGTWQDNELGINAGSGTTGAFEDEGFCCAVQPFAQDGLGAVYLRLLDAYQEARRPNGYREQDGSPINLGLHSGLVMYNGRPDPRFSGDLLGLSVQPTAGFGPPTDTHGGYFGPDRQHWLCNALCEVEMLTGSGVLQHLIQDQMRIYLCSDTVEPWLLTSHSDAPRAVGWTMLAMAKCHWACDATALADRVKNRALARLGSVYLPELMVRQDDQFEVVEDPRILTQFAEPRPQWAWVPWQHSIAVIGLCAAYEEFGDSRWLLLAHQAAKAVTEKGWQGPDAQGHYTPVEAVAYPYDGRTAPFPRDVVGGFGEWMAAAPALLLKYRAVLQQAEPALIARAQAIVDQVRAQVPASRWMVPA